MTRNAPWALAWSLIWALASPCAQAAETVRVCLGDVAHPPYRLADAQGRTQRRGLDFVFLDLLAQRSGLQIQSELLPGRRCLLELKAGHQDMLFSISHLPEREDAALFPMRNGQPDGLLALRSHSQYAWYVPPAIHLASGTAASLSGLSPQQAVGAQTGYSISAHLREQGFVVDDGVRSATLNFEKLIKDRFRGPGRSGVGGRRRAPATAGLGPTPAPPGSADPRAPLLHGTGSPPCNSQRHESRSVVGADR